MDSEYCPKTRNRKHERRVFYGISDPEKKPLYVGCLKCGKTFIDYTKEEDEPAFPDLAKPVPPKSN